MPDWCRFFHPMKTPANHADIVRFPDWKQAENMPF